MSGEKETAILYPSISSTIEGRKNYDKDDEETELCFPPLSHTIPSSTSSLLPVVDGGGVDKSSSTALLNDALSSYSTQMSPGSSSTGSSISPTGIDGKFDDESKDKVKSICSL